MSDTKVALIGHRGVGKTQLLERLRVYFPQFQYFDLDAVIAKNTSKPIKKIFEQFGEDYFRNKENQFAHELLAKKDVIVSLGAGYNIDLLPEDVFCIWVRRATDKDGRIFLNRPSLEKDMEPLDEFFSRFEKRNKKYFENADFIYDMCEGISLIDSKSATKKGILLQEKNLFKDILFRTLKKRKGVLTLNSRNLNHKLLYDTVEFRTDYFSAKDIVGLVGASRKKAKILLSFRKNKQHDVNELADTLADVDWIDVDTQMPEIIERIDFNFPAAIRKKMMISCHIDNVNANIKQLDLVSKGRTKKALKCSPVIRTFSELKLIYDWQRKDPKNRFIFPRSNEGDWQWFRCFMLSKQSLNFVNDGFSNIPDQPTLIDTSIYGDEFSAFAAVVGNPIHHSYSPIFHAEFMKKRSMPYFRIKIEEKEFDSAMDCLEYFGLKAVSITAPFKESVYRKYAKRLGQELKTKSVNTVFFHEKKQVYVSNTDGIGVQKTLRAMADELFKKPLSELTIVLWGGGGVVATIKNEAPTVQLVPSRDGSLPKGIKQIDILIWAAPRSLLTKTPKNCTIKSIFDLSYTESSMGLELAKKYSIPYFSGLEMFKEQGRGQQLFWSQFDERK